MTTDACWVCGRQHERGAYFRPVLLDLVNVLPPEHPAVRRQVARIAAGSTPTRELAPDGSFRGWINPKPLGAPGEPSQAIAAVPHAAAVRRVGSPGVPRGRQPAAAGE